jgi:HAD superfamily hydrolase (TIGR01509 family)
MPLPRPVKAVIFDMDGLLIDSETVYIEALIAEALARGHELPPVIAKKMIGHTWVAGLPSLLDYLGPDLDTDGFRERVIERFYELAHAGVALKAGVLEILDRLDALGLPRGVATSSRRVDVDHHLGHHDLARRFHVILAHGEYPRTKPHPDPYLKAAEAMGVDPAHCLVLEDSYNGVRAGVAAGMMTVMVPDLLDPTEEMETLCVRIARDLHEVRGWL